MPGTARHQVHLLRFLREYTARNKFAPSYEEIRVGLGLSSKSYVFRLVQILEKRGVIVRDKPTDRSYGRARSLTLVTHVKCPSCGADVRLPLKGLV